MKDRQDLDPVPVCPTPPDEFECCDSGCGEACVWEKYYLDRERYDKALAEWKARHPEMREAHG